MKGGPRGQGYDCTTCRAPVVVDTERRLVAVAIEVAVAVAIEVSVAVAIEVAGAIEVAVAVAVAVAIEVVVAVGRHQELPCCLNSLLP